MLTYEELLQKYLLLQQENVALRAELAMLKGTSSQNETVTTVPSPHSTSIHKHSSSADKINLFRSLFLGREDVFARRWYSIRTEKSGYQPVCGNEWDEQLCDKKKYKCSLCPNRALLPLTDRDIYDHLAGKDAYGRDVVGIYPMLEDETVHFCCVDFDDDGFESAAKAYHLVCAENDVPAYIERSRSGKGAHVWIFFSVPISAKTARQLASGLLTAAMGRCSRIEFRSYDRIFPNQDTMPNGGLKNFSVSPRKSPSRKKAGDERHRGLRLDFLARERIRSTGTSMSQSCSRSLTETMSKNW